MIEADKMISIEKFLLFTSIVLLITWFLCNILKIWCNSLRNDVKYDVGIPPFGSHWREILNIESWQETLHRLYYKYPNERFVVLSGIGGRPEYLIRSPELVKQIAIGDFSSFVNRNSGIHATTDPILGNALTNLTTNDWRRVRNVLTPLLCGKRLKQIVIPSLDENKRDLVQFVCDECKKISTNELIVDMMDLSTRSAVDAFCLTAFGLKTDSLRSAGRDYGFFATAQSYIANGPSAVSAAMYWAITSFPFTMKLLFGKTLMPKSDQDFFQKSCRDIADNRIANQINRFDYVNLLQILRDANKNGDNNSISMIRAFIQFERKKFRQNNRLAIIYLNRFSNRMFFPLVDCNDVEMISQCFEFYESVITENNLIMTFIAQRLAEQPDIQQRLYTEMNEMKGRIGDKHLTYDDVAGMKYADMVIKEGLRMCMIAPELRRRATKSYILENSNGAKVEIKPGDAVWLPSFILQNDPRYYSNPLVFDPDRFSDENRKSHVAGTYAPFGMGPRDCIGCQYALVEVKIALYHLLINFIIESTENASNEHSIKLKQRQ